MLLIDNGVPMLHIDEALNEEGSGIADEKSERLIDGEEYDWEDDGIPKVLLLALLLLPLLLLPLLHYINHTNDYIYRLVK